MKSAACAMMGAVALSGLAALPASAAELRFCPAGGAWTYPLNDQRGMSSLVVQATALVNAAGPAFDAQSAEFALVSKGEVKESRRLSREDLVKAAAGAPRLNGLAQALPGVFCSGRLLGSAALAATPEVAQGQALLLFQQSFSWTGARDLVRVTVRGTQGGKPAEVTAELPIRQGMSRTVFHFPLKGAWYIGAGPSLQSHHRWARFEEFAYDIIRIDGQAKTHTGDGLKFSDYLDYGAPILAAADGKVVSASDGEPEFPAAMRQADESDGDYMKRLKQDQAMRLARGLTGIVGNYVVLDHGNGEFSMYVHMKPGSVKVKPGQSVKTGDQLGEVGSSGNSTEPHLHFQVCDGPSPLDCSGIPIQFTGLKDQEGALQTGDFVIPE